MLARRLTEAMGGRFELTSTVGEGTHAQLAPTCGCTTFCAIMSPIMSGLAHMPLPICALPVKPARTPISTLEFS